MTWTWTRFLDGESSALGTTSVTDASEVWQVRVTLTGEALQWGDSSQGQRTKLSRNETNLVAVAAGAYFTLGLRVNGTVMRGGRTPSAPLRCRMD